MVARIRASVTAGTLPLPSAQPEYARAMDDPRLAHALGLLGERWTAPVLDVLAARPAHFADLHRAVPGLPESLLGERLGELVAAGLVTRHAELGPIVRYELTERGHRLLPALEEIRGWAETLDDEVTGATELVTVASGG